MTKDIFKTSDQGLAAYLMCKGHFPLKAIPGSDPRRKEFVFIDVAHVTKLKTDYETFTPDLFAPKDFAMRFRQAGRIAREGLSEEDMDKMRND